MNELDHIWLRELKKKYPDSFKSAKVLELGSYNVNGTVRDHFEYCTFIGVDWREGKDVDVVSMAHETILEKEYFDTLISDNMFEHDPYWEKSINNSLQFLKKDGMIFFRFAGPDTVEHNLDGDPSKENRYYPKSKEVVVNFLESLGVKVLDSSSESNPSLAGQMISIVAQKV